MADGQVSFLALPLPKNLAIALLTVDGGEGDVHNRLDDYFRTSTRYSEVLRLERFS